MTTNLIYIYRLINILVSLAVGSHYEAINRGRPVPCCCPWWMQSTSDAGQQMQWSELTVWTFLRPNGLMCCLHLLPAKTEGIALISFTDPWDAMPLGQIRSRHHRRSCSALNAWLSVRRGNARPSNIGLYPTLWRTKQPEAVERSEANYTQLQGIGIILSVLFCIVFHCMSGKWQGTSR